MCLLIYNVHAHMYITYLDRRVVGSFITITSVMSPYLVKYSLRLSETIKLFLTIRYFSLYFSCRKTSYYIILIQRSIKKRFYRNAYLSFFYMKVSLYANTGLTKCGIATEIQIIPSHRHLSTKVRAEGNTEDH